MALLFVVTLFAIGVLYAAAAMLAEWDRPQRLRDREAMRDFRRARRALWKAGR